MSPRSIYSKAQYFDGLPDAAIDTIVTHTEDLPGPMTVVYLEPMGGAIGRVEPSATAFPHRDAAYSVHILPGWSDPDRDGELVDRAREFHDALDPYATGGVYVNLLGRDEADRIGAAYGRNYDRLVEIKREWDPENLFSSNRNIDPNARSGRVTVRRTQIRPTLTRG